MRAICYVHVVLRLINIILINILRIVEIMIHYAMLLTTCYCLFLITLFLQDNMLFFRYGPDKKFLTLMVSTTNLYSNVMRQFSCLVQLILLKNIGLYLTVYSRTSCMYACLIRTTNEYTLLQIIVHTDTWT
jgi:hypothetical protein